jgi:hypothetical protein
MSRVSKNTHPIDSLSETTRFANSNLLNTSLTHFARVKILTWAFFPCYLSHLYVHYQLHSPSVEKPDFGDDFLCHPTVPGLSKTLTVRKCSLVRNHESIPHFYSNSSLPKPCPLPPLVVNPPATKPCHLPPLVVNPQLFYSWCDVFQI